MPTRLLYWTATGKAQLVPPDKPIPTPRLVTLFATRDLAATYPVGLEERRVVQAMDGDRWDPSCRVTVWRPDGAGRWTCEMHVARLDLDGKTSRRAVVLVRKREHKFRIAIPRPPDALAYKGSEFHVANGRPLADVWRDLRFTLRSHVERGNLEARWAGRSSEPLAKEREVQHVPGQGWRTREGKRYRASDLPGEWTP